MPVRSLDVLLAGLVDYAGLFPPAGLAMGDAAREYAARLGGPDRWMLGRFVVPVARLRELAACAAELPVGAPWHLAVLGGADPAADAAAVREFREAHGERFVVDAVEARAESVDDVRRLADAWRGSAVLYAELPLDPDPAPLVDAVRAAGVRAKARTGGVTPEAIPPAPLVARFLARCVRAGVPFKCTAGLHHPLRAEHALTYQADAPRAEMHGFLNVWLAAALLASGAADADAERALLERDASAFHFDDAGAAWRGRRVSLDALRRVRERGAIAFGSCSFREPVDDLRALRLL